LIKICMFGIFCIILHSIFVYHTMHRY
jgi:hypothetical protein